MDRYPAAGGLLVLYMTGTKVSLQHVPSFTLGEKHETSNFQSPLIFPSVDFHITPGGDWTCRTLGGGAVNIYHSAAAAHMGCEAEVAAPPDDRGFNICLLRRHMIRCGS